ncbi:MAG: DegT/DnrJ/EryC1/StrS family aminotransferase [Candidatus Pacebacteria bacterium]|nr:DegT/DnrJ/EryC1/StrS family aminotransferase [Candidatus Paceibacterota bacterium]
MFEPVSVSLSPNAFKADVWRSMRVLARPSDWCRGEEPARLETEFENFFPGVKAASFASGRTAFWAILKALKIGKGDEVICQSFSCVVVANAILKVGARPVFGDIKKESFNLDPEDLLKKITPRTKAIVVQHTFGLPAETEKILQIAREYSLSVIEDCAHGIGFEYKGQKTGVLADAAFLSFGRDKAISSVFGGMSLTRRFGLAQQIKGIQESLNYPSPAWVRQQLFHPPLMAALLPVYNLFSLGKIILLGSQLGRLLSFPLSQGEKKGVFNEKLMARMPNGLAGLARFQFSRLSRFNQIRSRMVAYYAENLKELPVELPEFQSPDKQPFPLLRFTIRIDNPQDLYKFAKKRGVLLNNWYYPAVSPQGVDYKKIGYQPADCPVAEAVSARVVNLPTHPKMTLNQAQKVVKIIKDFYKEKR